MFTLSKVDFVERSLASALVARRHGADARATAALSAFDGLLAPSGGDDDRRQRRGCVSSPRWRGVFEIYRALDDQQQGCGQPCGTGRSCRGALEREDADAVVPYAFWSTF